MGLEVDQLEEQLRQQREALEQCQAQLLQEREALRQEQLRRAAAELLLQEKGQENRQEDQRLLEAQRAFAAESRQEEHRLMMYQRSLAAESRQEEQRLLEWQQSLEQQQRREGEQVLDGWRTLEQERLCFNIEREHAEEERRHFLLHQVHEADSDLMKRERQLNERMQELDRQSAQVEEEKGQLVMEQDALTDAGLHLAESANRLSDRESRVADRERLHAATIDCASQTPFFHPGIVRRRLCCKFCCWSIKLLLLLSALLTMLFIIAPHPWHDLSAHSRDMLSWSGVEDIMREYGFIQPCPPCQLAMQAPHSLLNDSNSEIPLSELCSRVPAVQIHGPPTAPHAAAVDYLMPAMGGLSAVMVYIKGP
jgi:hypothetical protein